MKKLLFVSLIIIAVCFCNCRSDTSINRYVFIDDSYVLHTNPKCTGIYKADKGELIILQVDSLTEGNLGRICSRCVDSNQFKELINSVN